MSDTHQFMFLPSVQSVFTRFAPVSRDSRSG